MGSLAMLCFAGMPRWRWQDADDGQCGPIPRLCTGDSLLSAICCKSGGLPDGRPGRCTSPHQLV